jgi:hypothetical protein
MRFNFKKIAAVGASVLLTGLSMGMATAATYPAPFVQNGQANVAIVVGSNASPTDTQSAADPISANLQTYLSSSGSATLSGEVVPLGASNNEIYLGSSIAGGRYTTITSSQLPTAFADGQFSGGSDSSPIQYRVTLDPTSNNKVIFDKKNGTVDPSYLVQMSTSRGMPLYNMTIHFTNPINFTDANNQGSTLTLFGKDFTVGTDSSNANGIVLLTGAVPPLSLSTGDSQTVTVDGVKHTITLRGVANGQANIKVDGVAKPVTSGNTVTINGVSIGVTNLFPDTSAVKGSANVLVGSNKMYLKDGNYVKTTTGTTTHTLQGTYVTLTGGANATTQIEISVYATGSLTQNIPSGTTFLDPVFGAFGLTFSGMSSPLSDSARDSISVANSGDDTMQLTMTDSNGNQGTFSFAYNHSGVYNMSNPDGQIFPYEGANMSLNDYTILASGGKLTSGQLIQVTNLANDTGTDSDAVDAQNFFSGDSLAGGSGTIPISSDGVATYYGLDGNYAFSYTGNAGSPVHVWQKNTNAVSGESSGDFVLYPAMAAKGGARVQLYEPLTVDLGSFAATGRKVTHFLIPQGDSYLSVPLSYPVAAGWKVNGDNLNATGGVNVTTDGGLIYNFASSATNSTTVSVYAPHTGSLITTPSVIVLEPENDANVFNAVVITTSDPTSSKVGVGNVYFSDSTAYTDKTLQSNSKLHDYVDSFGTMVQTDTSVSSQTTATLTYPAQQSYAQLYFGAAGSSVSSGSNSTQTGMFVVSDSQASSMSGKNLIVVGGSCVNSAAATLLGSSSPLCTTDWESATGVGSGQFIVKSYSAANSNGLVTGNNIALLVAGYEAADTIAAANWLTTASNVDLSKTHTGITSTGAVTVVS